MNHLIFVMKAYMPNFKHLVPFLSQVTLIFQGVPPDLGESDFFNLGDSPKSKGIDFVQFTKISKMGKLTCSNSQKSLNSISSRESK